MSIFLIILKVNMQWITIRYESYLLLQKIILRLIERAHASLSWQPPLTKNEGEGFMDNHQYKSVYAKIFGQNTPRAGRSSLDRSLIGP